MPIFEYKCIDCDKTAEFFERGRKENVRTCPHCGSTNLHKQFSVFSPKINEGSSKKCLGCTDNKCPHVV